MTLTTAEPDSLFAEKGTARPAVPREARAAREAEGPGALPAAPSVITAQSEAAIEQELPLGDGDAAEASLAPAGSLGSSHIVRAPKATPHDDSTAVDDAADHEIERTEEPTPGLTGKLAALLMRQGIENRIGLFAAAMALSALIVVLLMVWTNQHEVPAAAISKAQPSAEPSPSSRLTPAIVAPGSGDYLPSAALSTLLAASSRAQGSGNQ